MTAAADSPRELELTVGPVAHGGIFVARHEGRVVFVGDALPGERVVARVTDTSKAKFWRAETVRVLDASPDRRQHVWAEASVDRDPDERVGGAEFGHIDRARQRELKAEVLRDSMVRFGHLPAADVEGIDVAELPGAADGTGWRTRVRLHVDDDGLVGPYVARSHRVVATRTLPLAAPAIQEVAPVGERLPGETGVDLVATSVGDVRVLPLSTPPGPSVRERVGDREFELAERGFWQVHTAAASTLTGAVQDAVRPELLDPDAANLDLYGGVGLLAAAVADRFGSSLRITTVEADATATGFAARNLADLSGADAVTARVDRYLTGLERSSRKMRDRLERSTVILDPPRSGAGAQVMRTLGRLRPAQLVYVACDPVALGRDVGLARDSGYRLVGLRGFDLFPHTHHVEAVATLVRDS